MIALADIPADRPVLIAGPTASGKSGLALAIAEAQGGVVINADALQVFDGWRILTARPTAQDEARAPHRLYGHVARDGAYSVGHWLRELRDLLGTGIRPIVTGGTGLYLSALTDGLAAIPPVPAAIRAQADAMALDALLAGVEAGTLAGIDRRNRARVQRAWEVEAATGRPLAAWQADTPAPLLPLAQVTPLVLRAERDWLDPRIAARFDAMLQAGLLDEARAMRPGWSPAHASSRAIGAAELIAHLDGRMTAEALRAAVLVASRQYAKRQRTWFRARMRDWRWIDPPGG